MGHAERREHPIIKDRVIWCNFYDSPAVMVIIPNSRTNCNQCKQVLWCYTDQGIGPTEQAKWTGRPIGRMPLDK